jgi:hypothetical protein
MDGTTRADYRNLKMSATNTAIRAVAIASALTLSTCSSSPSSNSSVAPHDPPVLHNPTTEIAPQATAADAEIARLEQKQLDAQAVHMRAVAAHERNSDCQTFERCRDSIPSVRELPPGEFSRLTRACERSKSESCRTSERALEIARADSLAVISEVAASRNRLNSGRAATQQENIDDESIEVLNSIFHAMSEYFRKYHKTPPPIELTPSRVPCGAYQWTTAERARWEKILGAAPTLALRAAYEVRDAAEYNLKDGTLLLIRALVDRDCDGLPGTIELSVGVKDGELIHAKGFYHEHDDE